MSHPAQAKRRTAALSRLALSTETILVAIIVFTLILVELSHFAFLTTYPPILIDESWNSNAAWTWLTTGVNFDSIHAGTRDQFGYEWLLMPALGNAPWVISFALLGLGLFQARLVSYIFGILLLLSTIWVGRRAYNTRTGLLAALFLSLSLPFLQSSHWARWDIVLAAVVMLAYLIAIYALQKNKWWAHLLAGFLIGGSIDIHPNGTLFVLALAAMYVVTYKYQILRKTGTWLVATGGLLGIIYYVAIHILPNPAAYFAMLSLSAGTSNQIPIQTLSLSGLLGALDGEIGIYHFYDYNLDFALIGASTLFLAFRRKQSDILLLTFVISAFCGAVLFRGFKADIYAILLYPFFMLMVAEMFTSLTFHNPAYKGYKVVTAALLLLFLFNSVIHYARPVYRNRDYDYYAITEKIKQVIPADARVMGSPTWWLGMSEFDYRSTLNLQFYNFFNGYSLTEGIEAIRPDIIIMDPVLEEMIFDEFMSLGKNPFITLPRQEFEQFIAKHGKVILAYPDSPVQVFSVEWGAEEYTRGSLKDQSNRRGLGLSKSIQFSQPIDNLPFMTTPTSPKRVDHEITQTP